jgi:hypothetical protein
VEQNLVADRYRQLCQQCLRLARAVHQDHLAEALTKAAREFADLADQAVTGSPAPGPAAGAELTAEALALWQGRGENGS